MPDNYDHGQKVLRKMFCVVSNATFAAFLVQAKNDGWMQKDAEGRVDIDGVLTTLVEAYSEGRVMILPAHALAEAKKSIAKIRLENGEEMGTKKCI